MQLWKVVRLGIQLFVVVFMLGVILLLADQFKIIETLKPLVVMSGSMQPSLKSGSVVFVRRQSAYSSRDIITFYPDGDKNNPVTHRVVFRRLASDPKEGSTYFTAGDANEELDRWRVKDRQIVGKTIFSIPYLGYLVQFSKQPYGFILLVIVPATIIIYEELKLVLREFLKFFHGLRKSIRLRKRDENDKEIKVPSINLLPKLQLDFPKATVISTITATTLVMAVFTGSYFFDPESSLGNVFRVADSFGPALANHLVINEVYYDVDLRSHGSNTENEPANEWIEIYNPTNSPVPFKDWQICDNNDCVSVNPNVSIPALGFALLSRDASTWNFWTIPSGVETIHSLGGTPLALANTDDRVILKDNNDNEVDRMSWGTDVSGFISGCSTVCPSVSEGHSLEREPDGVDTDGASDFVDRTLPTPGA